MAISRKLKRTECFLGIHFDFHADDDALEIGKNVTPEMVEHIIREVQPDYIQCDCKGHRGLSSYLTNVGYRAPGFVSDQLRVWREVTEKNNVPLFMHYSGVWDEEALRHHPEWASVGASGERDLYQTSVFGPYVDELMLPQLKELSDEYAVDGAWVDGDCWATVRDYSDKAIALFRERTGIHDVPRKPDDPHYAEYSEFCRDGFREFLRYYVDEMHKHNPAFEIASNWAFSSFMPEPVSADVDFISGDFTLQNSLNSARMEARCLVYQGKSWDIMAWSFSSTFDEAVLRASSTKSIVQLQQEASLVLAQGGGFAAYFHQFNDGSSGLWQMKLMSETAKFCRAREAFCHKAVPVPQIGLLYSGAAFYKQEQSLFGAHDALTPIRGVLQSLLDSQQVVDVVMEHHLNGRMADYPLIIVPEWPYLEPSFREQLLQYVDGGGNLLLIGPKTAAMFEAELGIRLEGSIREGAIQYLEQDGWLAGHKTDSQAVTLLTHAVPFGKVYERNEDTGRHVPAASVARYGKGRIAATYLNFGERYANAATSTARKFLQALVLELFPEPVAEVKGSSSVDVVLNRKGNRLQIHLINTAGPHANGKVYVYDEIPPIGPLTVTVRVEKEPGKVTLEPGGRVVAYRYDSGLLKLTVDRLEIYDIVVLDMN